MLVAIAGCSSQAANVRKTDALNPGVTDSGGGARTGVLVVTASAGAGGHRDGVGKSDSEQTAGNGSVGLRLPQRYLAF